MSKFTPKPWKINGKYILAPEGEYKDEIWVPIVAIAINKNQSANARLIAAAPEMYEMLKQFTDFRLGNLAYNPTPEAKKLLKRIDGDE